MKKRLLSLVLTAVMLLGLLPSAALAAELDTGKDAAPDVLTDETPEEVPGGSVPDTPADVPGEASPDDGVLAVTAAGEDLAETPIGNLCRPSDNVTVGASATSEQDATNAASHVIDGSFAAKWGSAQNATNPALTIDLGTTRAVSVVRIYWECASSVTSSAVNAFKIETSLTGADGSWTAAKEVTGQQPANSNGAQAPACDYTFGPRNARYVRVTSTGYQSGSPWNAACMWEVEIYRDTLAIPVDPATVAAAVKFKVENGRVVPDTASAAALAGEWEFDYTFAANLEQVVGADGTVHTPLVNTKVELDVTATRRFDGVSGSTPANAPYALIVPGEHVANVGNPKPKVIPELMEWYSSSAQKGQNYTLTAQSKIVAPAALTDVANEVKADIRDLFGFDLTVAATGAAAGDIVLVLDEAKAREGFDDETYLMEVTDRVTITASHATGVYWGTRSALQALKLSHGNNTIPQGTARDYPEFPLRGFVLDVGRKPISMKKLEEITKNMAWYKLNDFHVHINDNLITMEDYKEAGESWNDTEVYKKADRAYSAFRLESGIREEAGARPLTAKDYHYTKAEYKAFVENSAKLGVNIVTEIDVPAHAKAITDAFPSVQLVGYRGNNPTANEHPYNDHLDLSTTEKHAASVAITKNIFNEYLDAGIFGSSVHFGADEYYASGTPYRRFVKDMITYLKEKKSTDPALADLTIRQWGSLTQMSSTEAGLTDNDLRSIVSGVQMNVWNSGWANPQSMYNLGYDLINTLDGSLYIVPDAGYYHDYLNSSDIYNNWTPNKFESTWIPAGSSQMLGAAYAIWNDKIDTQANGIDEIEVYDRFAQVLPYISVKMWGEGDRLDRTLDELQTDAALIGTAPQTNPYHTVEPNADSGKHFQYDFAADGSDSSGNNRTLTLYNAAVTDCALALNGSASYAETGMDFLGYNSTLSFKIKVTQAPAEGGAVIFESDHLAEGSTMAYNEYAIKALPAANGKWKLGFSRELYDYEFATEFELGQWYTLKLENVRNALGAPANASSGTKLYVGEGSTTAVSAVGKFVSNENSNTNFAGRTGITKSYFQLPVARIGSKTGSFVGSVDDVSSTSPAVEPPQIPEEGTQLVNLALRRPVTVSATGTKIGGSAASDPDLAVDGALPAGDIQEDYAWIGGDMTTNRVNGAQNPPQWLVVDLGQDVADAHLKPEQLNIAYGRRSWATKYDIQTSDSPDGPWASLLTASVTRNHAWGYIPGNYPLRWGGNNGDSITATSATAIKSDAVLKRYVRLYVTEVNAANGNDTTIGGNNGQCTSVAIAEFQVMARVPETESAENVRAYQISDSGVYLTWDAPDATYYQVYAKAPGGNWTCVSGDEVVNGNAFTHTGYASGTVYRVLTPGSHPDSPAPSATPTDIRTTGEGGCVLNTAADRVTYSDGWQSWDQEPSGTYVGPSVTFCNAPTANLTAEFVFVGVGVQVIGGMKNGGGRMTVEIDGEPVGVADYNNSSSAAHKQVVFEKGGLADGFHTVKLTGVPGTGTVEIEAFRVLVPAEGVTLSADGLADGAMTLTAGGAAVNVTASPSPVNGWSELTWTSSSASVTVTPSDDPKVAAITPVSAGTATVTVQDAHNQAIRAQITVTVNPGTQPEVHVTQVTLPEAQRNVTLYLRPAAGQSNTLQLTPTVLPENADDRSVTYSSGAESVATVSPSGLITAVAAGQTTVTVTTTDGNHTATCQVTVRAPEQPEVHVTQVTLPEAQRNVTLYLQPAAGQSNTLQLTPTVLPEDADDRSVTYSSGAPSVATVSQSGLITAVAAGQTTVTVTTTDGNHTATCQVTVRAPEQPQPPTPPAPSGGNGGGTVVLPNITTDTSDNADGSNTTTETNHTTGAVTTTTQWPDGKVVETVTDKEGGVTITVTNADGEEDARIVIPAHIPTPDSDFVDVPKGHWAEASIDAMAGLGLVQGIGGNRYDPATPMTRGSLATVFYRLSNGRPNDGVTSFLDVDNGKWYAESISWAATRGIVQGYTPQTFAPNDAITREQLAVMLARYAQLIGLDTQADRMVLGAFADGANTSAWAEAGTAWCVKTGILRGKDAGALDPGANVTRAEVAVMLSRFLELL